jgi:hypothetical protein
MAQYEAFQAVAAVGLQFQVKSVMMQYTAEHKINLTINHIHDILDMVLALTVSARPIVASSSTLGIHDKIFWVV